MLSTAACTVLGLNVSCVSTVFLSPTAPPCSPLLCHVVPVCRKSVPACSSSCLTQVTWQYACVVHPDAPHKFKSPRCLLLSLTLSLPHCLLKAVHLFCTESIQHLSCTCDRSPDNVLTKLPFVYAGSAALSPILGVADLAAGLLNLGLAGYNTYQLRGISKLQKVQHAML